MHENSANQNADGGTNCSSSQEDLTGGHELVCLLKAGDSRAISDLWDSYVPRLIRIAGGMMRGAPLNNSEDIAHSAFKSFCLRVRDGHFGELTRRSELWSLLLTITVRKVYREFRRNRKGHTVNLSDLIDHIAAHQPSTEEVIEALDTWEYLMRILPDDETREIVGLRLEGMTLKQIAEAKSVSLSKVERRTRLAKNLWQTRLEDQAGTADVP